MCREGGCGCCVVSVTRNDLSTGKDATIAVNSVRDFFNNFQNKTEQNFILCISFICYVLCPVIEREFLLGMGIIL